MGNNKKYWKGLDELNATPDFMERAEREFPQELSVDQFLADDKLKESSTGRRDFLKFLGFSVAAATVAACESPVVNAVPYVVKPEDELKVGQVISVKVLEVNAEQKKISLSKRQAEAPSEEAVAEEVAVETED